MPSLQVRELPESIYQKLVKEAEKEHRSLAQQAVAVLARGLGVTDSARERRRRVLDLMRAEPLVAGRKRVRNPAGLVREDRDR